MKEFQKYLNSLSHSKREGVELRVFVDFIRIATGKDPLYAPGRVQDYVPKG